MSNTRISDFSVEINDIRTPSDFRSSSFSNYKKSEVKVQLVENMKNGKVEPACYWSAELICAGHYVELWDVIVYFIGKYIHIANPKIVIYAEKRYKVFKNIISQDIFYNELDIRNYNNVRKLFAELISILTLSVRKHSIEPMKINRNEFDITYMTERLKAPSTEYIKDVFHSKDSPEVYIPMNEFAYHVSRDSSNITMAWYWIEWIIEFDLFCKTRERKNKNRVLIDIERDAEWKEPCRCEKRDRYRVEEKYRRDIIWLVWDVLIKYSEEKGDEYVQRLMDSLVDLFTIKYTGSSSKKRRYLLYYGVMILKEDLSMEIEIIESKDRDKVSTIVENIDEIYRQIKVGELSPKSEYIWRDLL
jgi:hypothetical protein